VIFRQNVSKSGPFSFLCEVPLSTILTNTAAHLTQRLKKLKFYAQLKRRLVFGQNFWKAQWSEKSR